MDDVSPPRPHVIGPEQVGGWLADSINKAVTYHRNSHEAAQDIVDRGVDVSRSRIGAYGQGSYTATEEDVFFGDLEVAVAVRTVRPLVGTLESVGQFVDDLILRLFGPRASLTPPVAAAVRLELLRLGFDGIIVRDAGGDGIDYVIALDGGTVKVIAQ